MATFLFMEPVLRTVSQGKLLSRVFAIILQILAIVALIAGLVSWIAAWGAVFYLPVVGVLGGIIFQLFFVAAIYMVVHTLLIRAREIADLPEAEYTAIPILAVFFRLVGEAFAAFVVPIAIGGGILMWLAGGYAYRLLGGIGSFIPHLGEVWFIGGITLMVFGVLISFLVLLYCYWLSEFTIVLVDIARSTRGTRRIADQYERAKEGP